MSAAEATEEESTRVDIKLFYFICIAMVGHLRLQSKEIAKKNPVYANKCLNGFS